MKTYPRKVPLWFYGAMFIIAVALVVLAYHMSFVWLIGK